MAIELKIEATVKITDLGQLESEAYKSAIAELVDAYPLAVPALLNQDYINGEHRYTFDVSNAVPAREISHAVAA